MSDKDHVKALRAAIDTLNAVVEAARDDGLGVSLSCDGVSVVRLESVVRHLKIEQG